MDGGGGKTSFLPTDEPSEVEKLQVNCLRLENQVKTLKEVSEIRKNLLELRERESKDLIRRLKYFEDVLALEKESREILTNRMKAADSEYEELGIKLSENVIALNEARTGYEKRIRALVIQLDVSAESVQQLTTEKEELETRLFNQLESHQTELEAAEKTFRRFREDELEKMRNLEKSLVESTREKEELEMMLQEKEEMLQVLESRLLEIGAMDHTSEMEGARDRIQKLEEELELTVEKNKNLSYQMTLLNTLFNETEGTPIDFERIKAIGDIVKESCRCEGGFEDAEVPDASEPASTSTVLDVSGFIERLEEAERIQMPEIPGQESCYKSVERRGGGLELVLSVSRTFIKLKDLILEKRSLQQEIDGLKQLNKKLETKVDTQSRRLYLVSLELNKTWKLVSKLKAQHGQLHSSKAVLRYELQEKRRLLEKLKRDLSLSREKWIKVRQKNLASQLEWESIRDEFARRREEVSSQSQESAFYEGSISTTPSSMDILENVGVDENLMSPDDMDARRQTSEKIMADNGSTDADVVVDGFVIDLAAEINSIEAEVEEVEDPALAEDEDAESNAGLTYEELISRRAHRLRELEEQCRLLYSRLQSSTARNTELASKLANLHSHYGSENSPEEDSAIETDEIGILSEASGDTAYASTSGQPFIPRDDDATEVPSEIEDEAENSLHEATASQHLYEIQPPNFRVEVLPAVIRSATVTTPGISAGSQAEGNLNQRNSGTNSQSHSNLLISSETVESERLGMRRSSAPVPNPRSSSSGLLRIEAQGDNIRRETNNTRNGSTQELLTELCRTIDAAAVVAGGNDEQDSVGRTPVMTSLALQPSSSLSMSNDPLDDFESYDGEGEENREAENKGSNTDTESPSELNLLSRLIKELPKILEVLKEENFKLKTQAGETEQVMKKMKTELDEQKEITSLLRPRIESAEQAEMELRGELDLKQLLIQELTTKIQIATENYDSVNKENGRMAEYFKLKMEERKIEEQRKLVKMRNMKSCTKCSKKFTFFKRKIHCSTCGHSFCSDCLKEHCENFTGTNSRSALKKILVCSSCDERKRKLENTEKNLATIKI